MTLTSPVAALARPPRSRRARRAGALVAGALVVALVAGCGGSGGAPSESPEGAASGFPRTVEHAMGSTEIVAPPQGIAALDSSFVDHSTALGVRVAAYTRFPTGEGQVPAYYGPEDRRLIEGAQEVGTLNAPDVEALFDVAPDVIISARVRHEQYYGQLQQVAPTVFTETTGPTWKDNVRFVGRVVGREQEAEAKLADYQARAQQVGENIRAANAGTAPTVSLVRFTAGEATVRLGTTGSFPGIVLTDVGLTRPPGQPDDPSGVAVDLPQERITELDADRIFVAAFVSSETPDTGTRSQYEANPLWATLQGQRAEVDDESWYVSGSLQGAHRILDDLAATFGVDPARG